MLQRSWALAVLLLLLVCGAATAAPVTVQLRVEGVTSTIFEGPVTTDGRMVDGHDGTGAHPCDGTTRTTPPLPTGPGPTMTSALDDAAMRFGFTWTGQWFSFGDFLVTKIGPDPATPSSTEFWETNRNWIATQVGGCQEQVGSGDELLFAYGTGSEPLLRLTGPARVATGTDATVTVTNGETGAPVAGATVGAAVSGPDGSAPVTFGSPGLVSLKAVQTGAIRSNAVRVCVSASGTEDCGVPPETLGARKAVRDSVAPRARISGPRDGRRYKRGPRLLRGVASDAETGVTQVKLAFRRHAQGGCRWWSGRRERFVGSNCHKKFFFAIGQDARWSYLLPRPLPPGRYVLDVKAFDRARNRDERFERGRNRVVFYVGSPRASARSAAQRGPSVDVMVVGTGRTLAEAATVPARALRVRAGGRTCKVAASTPLAALAAALRRDRIAYRLRDYGNCSWRTAAGSGQLYVNRVGSERGRGNDGWFYKVNDRAPEIGAADPTAATLRDGDRVLWFYCVFDTDSRSCQRSLRVFPGPTPVVGKPLRVGVRGYDNRGRSVPIAGARVAFGPANALTAADGVADLSVGPGRDRIVATKAGLVPSFPFPITVK
jgi:hypothetical protein